MLACRGPVAVLLWCFWLFLSSGATAQSSIFSWDSSGQSYASYSVFRDELMLAISRSKVRVLLITRQLTDPDVATAIFVAKLRDLNVKVMLDHSEIKHYASLHNYLATNGVSAQMRKLDPRSFNGLTTIVLDDSAWRLNVRLDPKTPGAVRVDRSPLTVPELIALFEQEGLRTVRPEETLSPGAKVPTNLRRVPRKASDTIAKGQAESREDEGKIARRLPRSTRLQRIQEGTLQPSDSVGKASGSTVEESTPSWESDITENQ